MSSRLGASFLVDPNHRLSPYLVFRDLSFRVQFGMKRDAQGIFQYQTIVGPRIKKEEQIEGITYPAGKKIK